MKRITSRLLAVSAALAATAAMAPIAQADEIPPPSFAEFEAATVRDADGQYIVNGDEPVSNRGNLREYYRQMTESASGHDELVVNRVNGRDDRWSQSQVGNLTYCVSSKFGKDYDRVVKAMNQGVAIWENASSAIEFTHVASQDRNCTTRNNNVVFSVEPTRTTSYIARAFFPSSPKSSRNVLVNANSLYNSGSWTPGNIMGHELGHVLGFRHEHTRPEAGTCFEDNNWRPLTPYDSASIMHYPQCNGSSGTLSFTATDRAGVQALYGA